MAEEAEVIDAFLASWEEADQGDGDGTDHDGAIADQGEAPPAPATMAGAQLADDQADVMLAIPATTMRQLEDLARLGDTTPAAIVAELVKLQHACEFPPAPPLDELAGDDRRKWTASTIRQHIRDRHAAGWSLASHEVQVEAPHLFKCASKVFRTWNQALHAAGVPVPALNCGAPARGLLRVRLARGYSQQRVADAACVSRAWISQVENGIGTPTEDVLVRLAAALNVEPAELLRG